MIIKSYETHKIDLNKNRFILIYGKNEGLKEEIKKNLFKNNNILIYEEKEVIDNSNSFIETLSSGSLFEEKIYNN